MVLELFGGGGGSGGGRSNILAGSVNYLQYVTNKYRKIPIISMGRSRVISMGVCLLGRLKDENRIVSFCRQ